MLLELDKVYHRRLGILRQQLLRLGQLKPAGLLDVVSQALAVYESLLNQAAKGNNTYVNVGDGFRPVELFPGQCDPSKR